MPKSGVYAQKLYTLMIPYMSAKSPRTAAAIPPTPKAKPKKRPEIIPSLLGRSSWAYRSMAGNAEESINPAPKLKIAVKGSDTCGKSRLKGAVPSIDTQMIIFRPNLSPSGPPTRVPAAVATVNMKRNICD